MKLFLTKLILLSTLWLSAQKTETIKQGLLSPEEYEVELSAADSSAEAILLYEKLTTVFVSIGGEAMETEYIARIKILKTSGLDRGNIMLPYYENDDDKEKIYDIDGFTYNMEAGKLQTIKMASSSVYDETVSDRKSLKKLILPNVKVGSVIEYHYRKRTPFSITATPRTWYFQGSIPFRWSEINITIPLTLSYRILFGGYLPLYIKNSADARCDYDGQLGTKYRFVVKDAPAFKDEAHITTYEDYISKVEFGFISYFSFQSNKTKNFSTSWGDIARYLNKHERFGEKFRKTAYLETTVASFASLADSLERLNAIFSYMTKTYTWNEQNRLLAENELKSVAEKAKGSSAELNFILLSLLRKSGFKANPVILSTRTNGKIKEEFPVLDKFNYTLVNVRLNGKDILLDVTDPFLIPGLLPARCLSDKGYIIEGDTVRAVSLRPAKSTMAISINAEINAKGEIKGTYSRLSDSYDALEYRGFVKQNSEKDLLSFHKQAHPNWEIENLVLENKETPFKSFRQNFEFTETVAPGAEGKIYFNPLFSMALTNNAFNEKERIYPVDLGNPYEMIVMVILKIPEGYAFEEIPKTLALALPGAGGRYSYIVETEGSIVRIKSRLLIANSYYPAEQYHYLRELYNALIQKQAELIVLKKL